MASIIDSSMEVFIECAWFSLRLACSVKGHKDESKTLDRDYCTAQQRNKSRTSSFMSVASTLYTRGYFAAPDHCHNVFFVRWTLVRHNTVNGTAPASSLMLV